MATGLYTPYGAPTPTSGFLTPQGMQPLTPTQTVQKIVKQMQTALAPQPTAVKTGGTKKTTGGTTTTTGGETGTTREAFTLPNINIPFPEFQTASEAQRAEFAERARTRAELEYDAIIQGLQQALGTNELGATQAMAWSKAAYEPIFEQITDWEKEEMERRRIDAASRGLYESGILTSNLNKAAESALKQKTTAGTESARAIEDIRKSYELQKGQVSEKIILANAQKGQFAGEYAKVLEDEWTTMVNAYNVNRWSAEFQQASANVTNMLAAKNVNLIMEQFDWQKQTDIWQKQQVDIQLAINKRQVEDTFKLGTEQNRIAAYIAGMTGKTTGGTGGTGGTTYNLGGFSSIDWGEIFK